jgi:multidrug efflux pump subunit AcrA (membrane-fusion protein)
MTTEQQPDQQAVDVPEQVQWLKKHHTRPYFKCLCNEGHPESCSDKAMLDYTDQLATALAAERQLRGEWQALAEQRLEHTRDAIDAGIEQLRAETERRKAAETELAAEREQRARIARYAQHLSTCAVFSPGHVVRDDNNTRAGCDCGLLEALAPPSAAPSGGEGA